MPPFPVVALELDVVLSWSVQAAGGSRRPGSPLPSEQLNEVDVTHTKKNSGVVVAEELPTV